MSVDEKATNYIEASDAATLSDRTLTAAQRFSKLCENTPFYRIEQLLMRIGVNVHALRSVLVWREELGRRLDEADRRVAHAIRALEGFSTAYMRLKTGARHTAFINEMRRVRKVLSGGDNGGSGGVEKSLSRLYASVREQLSEIKNEAPVDAAMLTAIEGDLKEVAGIHKTLHAVLVAELPKIAEPMAMGTLLDNNAWAALMCAIKVSPEAEKPRILAEAMAALVADMDRTARQIVKAKARTLANGATESEEAAASRKGCMLQASLHTMRKRLIALSASFYRYRAKQVVALAESTKSVTETMRHAAINVETAQAVNSFKHRHPIQRIMDDIRGMDVSLDSGRGANPHNGYSMGAIMRHFKNNYVERITNSGKTGNA